MTRSDKLLERVLRGTSDANIPFDGLLHLLGELGFEERIRGSHHIFTRTGVEEILNLQPRGSHAQTVSGETDTSGDPAVQVGGRHQ